MPVFASTQLELQEAVRRMVETEVAPIAQSLDYAKQRHAFGKPIAEFQGLQFMLADMSIQIDAARALLYDVTTRIDAGELDDVPQLASSVK